MTITRERLSVKKQVLASIIAMLSAVALPQIIHIIGHISGTGTSLGETLLPMHLPIIFIGLIAGPYAAGIAGFLSPLISFALTGMPMAAMLPFMMIELCAYGIFSGVFKDINTSVTLKVLFVQILGRSVRAAAILIGFYALGTAVNPAVILTSITTGLLGIILQLVIIPLAIFRLKDKN